MRSGTERLALVGPLERLGHGAVEVRDERQHLVSQIINRGEVAAAQEFAHQDTQPNLDLVQPRRVFRGVVEDDFVRLLHQEGSTCRHRLQDATLLFDAQVFRNSRDLGHVAHQAFGAVRVQVIHHDVPLSGAWVALNSAANVGQEIGFGAGRSN